MIEKKILHYRYNIFYFLIYAVSIIILLVSVEWGSIPKLAELFTFGLTLTSLFLALIAIIYSMISNFNISKNTSDLNEASNRIAEMTNKLEKSSSEIKNELSFIPQHFEKLQSQNKFILEKMEEKRESGESTNEINEQNIDEERIEEFLRRSSLSGLLLLLACKNSYETRIPFKIISLFPDNEDYIYGYLVASRASGAIDYTYKEDILNITTINNDIIKSIDDAVNKRAAELYKDEKEDLEREKQTINDIKNYFIEK